VMVLVEVLMHAARAARNSWNVGLRRALLAESMPASGPGASRSAPSLASLGDADRECHGEA